MKPIEFWCDTETTGLKCDKNFIIQIAYICRDRNRDEGAQILFKNNLNLRKDLFAPIEVEEGALKVNGYTMDDIISFKKESEVIKTVMKDIDSIPSSAIFCGFNTPFDIGFISQMFKRQNYDFSKYFTLQHDVYKIVRRMVLTGKMYFTDMKQSTIAKKLGVECINPHDALSDIETCIKINDKIEEMLCK